MVQAVYHLRGRHPKSDNLDGPEKRSALNLTFNDDPERDDAHWRLHLLWQRPMETAIPEPIE